MKKSVLVLVVTVLALPVLFVLRTVLHQVAFGLLFVDAFALLVALSFATTPSVARPVRQNGELHVPGSVAEILTTQDPTDFEYFSAAVIMGLRLGHRFHRRCGGSGDQGSDVLLFNERNERVVVQCKRYADNPVGSSEVRDFWSSIRLYNAVYGYFVTTSTFSRDAQQVLAAAGWQIRRIDGYQLDALLRGRRHEISLAWSEVLAQKNRGVLS